MGTWIGRKVTTKVTKGNIPAGSLGKISYISKNNLHVMFDWYTVGQWYSLSELVTKPSNKHD